MMVTDKQAVFQFIDELRELVERDDVEIGIRMMNVEARVSEFPDDHPQQVGSLHSYRYHTGDRQYDLSVTMVVPIPQEDRVEGLVYASPQQANDDPA